MGGVEPAQLILVQRRHEELQAQDNRMPLALAWWVASLPRPPNPMTDRVFALRLFDDHDEPASAPSLRGLYSDEMGQVPHDGEQVADLLMGDIGG